MPDPAPDTEPDKQPDPEGKTGDEGKKPEPAKVGEGESKQAGDEVGKLRKEAANYRTKLREAEANNEQLAARLSDVQRAEVERQITGTDGLQAASDFWTAGVQLDELRDGDGGIDPEKVKAARDRVLEQHPNWRHQAPVSFDGGARQPAHEDTPSFGEAVKRAGTG